MPASRSVRVLIVSPCPTHPPNRGNRVRVAELAARMRELGCDVWFAYWPAEAECPRETRRWWGDRLLVLPGADDVCAEQPTGFTDIDCWYDERVERSLLALHRTVRFDVVFVEYVFLSWVLDCFDGVLKVLDTHDAFADRDRMFARQGLPPDWYYTTPEAELQGLRRADVVIAIQQHEGRYFSGLGCRDVRVIGHCMRPVIDTTGEPDHTLLLHAASENAINRHAWATFCATTLPLIRSRAPRARLRVFGPLCAVIPDGPGYRRHGLVAHTASLYSEGGITISPATFGTGLRIKNVEALAHGCPVVTAPAGAQGMEDALGAGLLACDAPAGFADAVAQLTSSRERYLAARRDALDFARAYGECQISALHRLLGGAWAQ